MAKREPENKVPEEKKPHKSPTVEQIDENHRPAPEIVCATCRSSNWFLSGPELQCYCRVMYVIVWKSSAPGTISLCDENSK